MYRAPHQEVLAALEGTGLLEAVRDGRFPDLSEDLLRAVIEEAGRFASEVIAPLNAVGDREGARLADGIVTTPPGWKDAYKAWREAGWAGIGGPAEFGGQALPVTLSAVAQEYWNAAAMSFALCPMLTMGAVEALASHGSEELKRTYLPRLVSGEWAATMNLTEPQAGSDLGALRTRAERSEDGTYRILGQKIFITYGEHDLTENIVHLVLARLPDAPAGNRGISLFLVPKYLADETGGFTVRNDVFCSGLEHKLGIHGSPTCTMVYGDGVANQEPGAVGWLVGEEHRGLACMFTMMNNARLMVGIQGVGIAERALQQAEAYAAERRQGRAPGWSGEGMSPIALHPDVRRMLMEMRALTAAARAVCYACAGATDLASAEHSTQWQQRADLLTPVAKAFASDVGFEVASLGVQIHGGMGYIEETGVAQHLRDARIAMIYEGTNGIQAIDLVTRKLPMGEGGPIRAYLAELAEVAERAAASNRPDLGRIGGRLMDSLADLRATTQWLLEALRDGRQEDALAGATSYLRLFGLAAGGAYLAKAALVAAEDADRAAVARFFAERLAPQTTGLAAAIKSGAAVLQA